MSETWSPKAIASYLSEEAEEEILAAAEAQKAKKPAVAKALDKFKDIDEDWVAIGVPEFGDGDASIVEAVDIDGSTYDYNSFDNVAKMKAKQRWDSLRALAELVGVDLGKYDNDDDWVIT